MRSGVAAASGVLLSLAVGLPIGGCGKAETDRERFNDVLGDAAPVSRGSVDRGILQDLTAYKPQRYEPLPGFGGGSGGGAGGAGGDDAGVRSALKEYITALVELQPDGVLEAFVPEQIAELRQHEEVVRTLFDRLDTLQRVVADKSGRKDEKPNVDGLLSGVKINVVDVQNATLVIDAAAMGQGFPGAGMMASFGAAGSLPGGAIAGDGLPSGPLTYEEHLRPLFAEVCFRCHAADKAKGGLVLESYEALMRGGESGPEIAPGDPDGSRLWRLVSHQEEPHMPSKSPKLSDEQLTLIRAWIEQGAKAGEAAGGGQSMPAGAAAAAAMQLPPLPLVKAGGKWRFALPCALSAERAERVAEGLTAFAEDLDRVIAAIESAPEFDEQQITQLMMPAGLKLAPAVMAFVDCSDMPAAAQPPPKAEQKTGAAGEGEEGQAPEVGGRRRRTP